MREATNKQEPSSTEGGQVSYAKGDVVWVRATVVYNSPSSEYMDVHYDGLEIQAKLSDCRPVEPSSSPEIPDSSSEPLAVGDAVRFVSPGHNRHGTEGVLKSIHHGPKNAYMFVSNCGQFHRYCTIAELERVDQADPIDIKGSMQSLDGADTIQAGDLQWTDRDSKYRLCNFTIGMRVYQAIERGKAHGEKWVFYRRFREVGE